MTLFGKITSFSFSENMKYVFLIKFDSQNFTAVMVVHFCVFALTRSHPIYASDPTSQPFYGVIEVSNNLMQ